MNYVRMYSHCGDQWCKVETKMISFPAWEDCPTCGRWAKVEWTVSSHDLITMAKTCTDLSRKLQAQDEVYEDEDQEYGDAQEIIDDFGENKDEVDAVAFQLGLRAYNKNKNLPINQDSLPMRYLD